MNNRMSKKTSGKISEIGLGTAWLDIGMINKFMIWQELGMRWHGSIT